MKLWGKKERAPERPSSLEEGGGGEMRRIMRWQQAQIKKHLDEIEGILEASELEVQTITQGHKKGK